MSDESDAEAFNILKEDSGAIAYTESEDVHYDADKKEREHDRYPSHMPSSMKKNKKNVHITFMVTQEHTAERFMDLFEGWWVRHQLKPYNSDPNYLLWKDMLELDPVGAKPVPKTNIECWKELKVKGKPTTFVKKDFLKNLERFQEENYLFYRCSLRRFLCDQCESTLITWVMQQEHTKEPPLDKSNRFDKSVRITWESLKAEVLTYTKPTLGSYYFLTLFTMVRKLDWNLLIWASKIRKAMQRVSKRGKGWDVVVGPEAMDILVRGLQKSERKVLLDQLLRKEKLDAYPN